MHYHLEIVMPQVDNVEEVVTDIMRPFDENGEDTYNTFWDWHVVGGRFAGSKMESTLDQDKLQEFYKELNTKKVTVSSLICGKQELQSASQIPMVDELWATYFPSYQGKACPLFQHSNNQYDNQCLHGDVMPLADVQGNMKCNRVIFAGIDYEGEKLEAKHMVTDSIWNGCNHEDTVWDKTFGDALSRYKELLSSSKQEWKDKYMPTDKWLAVTVDYHS